MDGPGTIGGNVFNDFNNDGTDDGNGEVGQENVKVEVYDCDGMLVCETWTNADGDWNCTGLNDTEQYRVEFSTPLQDYLEPSFAGTDNGTNTQFVTAPSCEVDYGVINPADYCQANPDVILPCYVNGNTQDGTTANENTIVRFPYATNSAVTGSLSTYPGQNAETGTVYGMAYERESNRMFMSAFVKRHSGLLDNNSDGFGDLGAIYTLDLNTNTINLFTTVPNAGTIPNDAGRGLGALTGTSNDVAAFSKVGKEGVWVIWKLVRMANIFMLSICLLGNWSGSKLVLGLNRVLPFLWMAVMLVSVVLLRLK